jgi:hypothetical protein
LFAVVWPQEIGLDGVRLDVVKIVFVDFALEILVVASRPRLVLEVDLN